VGPQTTQVLRDQQDGSEKGADVEKSKRLASISVDQGGGVPEKGEGEPANPKKEENIVDLERGKKKTRSR